MDKDTDCSGIEGIVEDKLSWLLHHSVKPIMFYPLWSDSSDFITVGIDIESGKWLVPDSRSGMLARTSLQVLWGIIPTDKKADMLS